MVFVNYFLILSNKKKYFISECSCKIYLYVYQNEITLIIKKIIVYFK